MPAALPGSLESRRERKEGHSRVAPPWPRNRGQHGVPPLHTRPPRTPPRTPPCHAHLLAEVPDAPDLEGAGGLHVLQLHVDLGPRRTGQGQALQEGGHEVEGPLGLHGRALPGVGVTGGVPKPPQSPRKAAWGPGEPQVGSVPRGTWCPWGLPACPRASCPAPRATSGDGRRRCDVGGAVPVAAGPVPARRAQAWPEMCFSSRFRDSASFGRLWPAPPKKNPSGCTRVCWHQGPSPLAIGTNTQNFGESPRHPPRAGGAQCYWWVPLLGGSPLLAPQHR